MNKTKRNQHFNAFYTLTTDKFIDKNKISLNIKSILMYFFFFFIKGGIPHMQEISFSMVTVYDVCRILLLNLIILGLHEATS